AGGLLWAGLGAAAVGCGLICILWSAPARALFSYLRGRGGRMAERVPAFERAYESLRVVASPAALVWPTILSVVGWGAEGVALHVLLDGFGQAPALPLSIFFYATATLAGALIPVPGGLGVVEAMFQSQLVELGHVAEGPATAAMLMIRFATLWWAVIVGFCSLAILRKRFPHLLRETGAEGQPTT
ncbi:MAG TPA: lysylphosphatidylglycerol synthase transmembrane domain-containing protein, partial [Polyangiaceae bacterium]|nr:lysylphosphatidylglycerol synthase transmembrane domain-containing protein [Polyangiaceae bacterium]